MRSLDLQGPRFSINAFRQAVGRVSIRGEYFANLNCCGHVGLVTGACFSEIGHEAICTDRDEIRIASFEVSYLFTSPAWKVFFFQAEDGIRDLYVTGVQTCALPI